LPCVAATGTSQREESGIGGHVMWGSACDDHLGCVARTRTLSTLLGHRNMNESVVARPAGHPMRKRVLPALAVSEHHLDSPADLLQVFLQADSPNKID
jgi:hypothetical protein